MVRSEITGLDEASFHASNNCVCVCTDVNTIKPKRKQNLD